MRRKPAHSSKAFGPSRVTCFNAARAGKRPCISRCWTMFWARPSPMPETRASSGAEAVLASTPTALTQSSTTASSERASSGAEDLVEIVLILANADRLRIDLHQLGEWVLEPPSDRHRAAQRDIEVGQFPSGIGRSGVDRSAGLRNDHLGQRQLGMLPNQVRRQPIGFARGGAIT